MAGSYNHIVDDEGNFLSNDEFVGMIENLGDAYEMAEEMYGMIWVLIGTRNNQMNLPAVEVLEFARKHYKTGLEIAKATQKEKRR